MLIVIDCQWLTEDEDISSSPKRVKTHRTTSQRCYFSSKRVSPVQYSLGTHQFIRLTPTPFEPPVLRIAIQQSPMGLHVYLGVLNTVEDNNGRLLGDPGGTLLDDEVRCVWGIT